MRPCSARQATCAQASANPAASTAPVSLSNEPDAARHHRRAQKDEQHAGQLQM